MLVISESEFIVVGDVVIYIKRDGARMKIAIDAPRSVEVMRSDLVRNRLYEAGWVELALDRWQKGGRTLSMREALLAEEIV